MTDGRFSPYLRRWQLHAEGDALYTSGAALLPVCWRGLPAMLKLATQAEEQQGYAMLRWWRGRGAARVYAHCGPALLMERGQPERSLAVFSLAGADDEACRRACGVVARLHAAPRPGEGLPGQAPGATPLAAWFAALVHRAGGAEGDVLPAARRAAQQLLATPQEPHYLHGDIHHHNILDFGARGWLAIDPKGLVGERAFDYANLFCNPTPRICLDPGRFQARLGLVCTAGAIAPQRMLQWILAWAGLSALWHIEDGGDPDTALAVARMARAGLGG